MHVFLSPLLALMLLGQAVLGLCWHPIACADCQAKVGVQAVAEKDCCCVTPGSGSEEGTSPQCPSQGEKECTGVCTYLPTQNSVVDAYEWSVATDLFVLASMDVCSLGEELASTPLGHVALKPPVRLHLLNQILRI